MATQQRIFIAETFLRMLRSTPNPTPWQEAYIVRTAAQHGIPLDRISELSGVPLNRVDRIVNS